MYKRGMKILKDKTIAHIFAMVVMIIWGISYISIKIVVAEINPVLSAFYRFVIATIVLFLIMKIKYPEEKVIKEDRMKMALGGFFGVGLYFLFENYSVYFTSSSNVAILLSSIPIFMIITQRIVYKENLTAFKISGVTLSVIGLIIIIISKGKVSLFSKGMLGDLMALGAAICWVFYNLVTSKFKGCYKSITITAYQALWGCLFLAPSLIFQTSHIPSTKVILNLLFLSLFCSCLCYGLYIYSLEKLGATIVTTYINLQPIISLTAAYFLVKEKIMPIQIIGSLIIIAGVFLVSFGDKFDLNVFRKSI